jgi:hypothetical protein
MVSDSMRSRMTWGAFAQQAAQQGPGQVVSFPNAYPVALPSVFDLHHLTQNMFVVPVAFAKEHKRMLAHCKETLEYQNGAIAIHPKFTKLITSLKTAVEKGEGSLDKDATSHDDLFDAFRLSLLFWHRRSS